MKTLPINKKKGEIKIQIGERKTRLFLVPKDRAQGVVKLLQDFEIREDNLLPWRESVHDLTEKYTEPGVALRGARIKEGFTQSELGEKLAISQNHLSEMENGKRPIGKKMAKRLAELLNVGYKIFL
ncbi:MAG: helix-turn-helix transcriptional regulator [Nitrospirae bacterium]|nr:helix-turn-helix transcriptional regulator [Nitrospirota bacterium]MBI3351079.1 helix-turn-helix transcriptional regulator [Nitrospirota bacterium]